MYDFYDYFDSEKKDLPYTVPGEELEDYLRLLDMMLEGYLEFKGINSKTRLFSRGLVITESEMVNYFSMPPYFRERDIWDPVMAAASESAFEYINSRTALTKEAPGGKLKKGGKKSAAPQEGAPETRDLLRVGSLKEAFGLSRMELLAVLLALAPEINRKYERIFGFLQDDISSLKPTLGLLYALTGRILPRKGAEESVPMPLADRMYTYFLVRKEGQDGLSSPLTLQPLMKKLLMGIPDAEKITSGIFKLYEEEADIPLFFEKSYEDLAEIRGRESKPGSRMIYLENEDEETVLHLLHKVCAANSEKLYVMDLARMTALSQENMKLSLSELFIRLKLNGAELAVRCVPGDEAAFFTSQENGALNILKEIRENCSSDYVFIYGEREEPGELAAMFVPFLRIPDAPVSLRTKIWEHFLNTGTGIRIAPDIVVPDLADCYEIPYGKVRKVIGHAIATARLRQEPVIDRELILESLRQMNRVDFSGLAVFVNPAYTWDDITVTGSQKEIMKTACNRYRLRNRIGEAWGLKRKNAYGNGVSILLYGPPGTGKTMAAQVIANELSLPLYRVDISQISSKYIGETEKNLAVIFNAASKANVILFFDEADALFSKRTDVGDSHDKYANNETSYLLQKIEEYNGMSILATNYYNNFDNAFVRRITYAVHMESPDKATRYSLWTTILPKAAEKDTGIDFKFLADKFELSGSNIKAILYNAAYMAGAEQVPVGMKHIVRAMEYEFTKLGKLVNESDFEPYDIHLQSGGKKKDPAKKSLKDR